MQQHFHTSNDNQAKEAPKTLKIQYKYDPQELVYQFFGKVLKSWPGYRISDIQLLDGNIIEVTLSC